MSHKLAQAIELVPPSTLRPYEKNARTHSQEQIAQLAASIREFGFNNPILVDTENGVLAGHGRLEAAKKLGLLQVPIVRIGHLSPAMRRAYILADNKIAQNAGWDLDLLASEIASLGGEIDDFEIVGFSDDEVSNLLAGLETEMAAPAPPVHQQQSGLVPKTETETSPPPSGNTGPAVDPDEHWVAMPEFKQEDKTSFRHFIVHVVDEAGAAAFFKAIGQKDTGETKSIWYPPQERMDTESKRYG